MQSALAGGLALSPGWIGSATDGSDEYGYAVAGAGDVNGDGYADIVVGAPSARVDGEFGGSAYVHHGSAAGVQPDVAWTWTAGQYSQTGRSVTGIGDVNGDGFDDIAVGAIATGTNFAGSVAVFHGSAAGLSKAPDWTGESSPSDSYGWSVAGGDVNNDGYADLLVGATGAGPSDDYLGPGGVFLYYGSATGLSAVADWSYESLIDYSSAGNSVALGDINGDGYDDVVFGAPTIGVIWAFYGNDTVPRTDNVDWGVLAPIPGTSFGAGVAVADFNDDGFADVLAAGYQTKVGDVYAYYGSVDGPSETDPDWIVYGEGSWSSFGAALGSADIDADGVSDALVGAIQTGDNNEGAAYIYLGDAGGLPGAWDWKGSGFTNNSSHGWSIDNAGDVNGDGMDDLIVGAPFGGGGDGGSGGQAFVYAGCAGGNCPPGPLEFLDLVDGQDLDLATLKIAVKAAFDNEGDPLTYRFQLDTVDTFDGASFAEAELSDDGSGTITWDVANTANIELQAGGWWIRARAEDATGDGPWTTLSFTLTGDLLGPGTGKGNGGAGDGDGDGCKGCNAGSNGAAGFAFVALLLGLRRRRS